MLNLSVQIKLFNYVFDQVLTEFYVLTINEVILVLSGSLIALEVVRYECATIGI